jgi:hypothetical protein
LHDGNAAAGAPYGPWTRRLLGLVLAVLAGCSGGRIRAPALDPKAVAEAAMAQYDTNKDGYLDPKELERCPALNCCWKDLDSDGDGRLSAAEIEARVARYRESKIGLVVVVCGVELNDGPLSGATVTLKPESFLGPSIKPASGTTDEWGKAQMQIEGERVPGCQCGFYRVEISKKDQTGQDMIPARYNTETVLGLEVGPDVRGGVAVDTFRLESR